MLNPYLKTLSVVIIGLLALQGRAGMSDVSEETAQGKKDFDYFCYQCHAYAGDAKTLASRFLDPPPRDFTTTDPQLLTRELMLSAVTDGRPSTGMKSFSRVLDRKRRESVVDYIRLQFMSGHSYDGKYHTPANGWADHLSKYSLAYPFATGELATDTPPDELDEEQIIGKEMFKTSCVSCHDQGAVRNEGVIWRARSSSWPRRHYDHRSGAPDAVTSATPYQRHDQITDVSGESILIQKGQEIFLKNCAFCHAADGSGKNWIGSFMEPPAADLTGPRLALYSEEQIRLAILSGVPGGTMPAWRNLLNNDQMDQLVAYLFKRVLASEPKAEFQAIEIATRQQTPETPTWRRK